MMAKNKDTMQSNLTGLLDVDNMRLTYIEKESEKEYDLEETLRKYDGLEVSITLKVDSDIEPLNE